MSKLYQTLEQVFKMRINANSEIVPYIKKLSEMGKFDEPKKVAAIAILLDRLGKLEDEADMEKSLSDIVLPTTDNQPTSVEQTLPSASSEVVATPEMPIVENSTDENAVPIVSTEIPAIITPVDNTQEQPVDPAPIETPVETTVSEFTPENITDPVIPPTSDSTTTL